MLIDNNKPIYLTIKEIIENMIIARLIKADEQIPSTTVLSLEYNVNHITILKAMNLLVDEHIIYKKRGLGMFVTEQARSIILNKRLVQFNDIYIHPLLKEAKQLGLTETDIIEMIKKGIV